MALLSGMAGDDMSRTRSSFRQRELLAIDDLDQLASEPHLMAELRATLDDCADAGQLVLVTSPRAPATLANLSHDVRSRLSGGLVLQLDTPGPEARLRIVEQAAAALGRPISEEAAQRLSVGIVANTNELFAVLLRLLCGLPDSSGSDIQQVESLLADRSQRGASLREIIAVVARYYRLPQKLLKSSSRKQAVVSARAVAVYLARELAGTSYEQIGRALGGRDHTTIMHSYQTIDRDRRCDWQTQEALDHLRRVLSNV